MTTKKLPSEIRRMKRLGRYSAAMQHNGAKAEATWLDLASSDSPAAAILMRQLVSAARESVRGFEEGRATMATIGSLLTADPNWKPDE